MKMFYWRVSICLFLSVAAVSSYIDDSWLVGNARCADFNYALSNAHNIQLNNPFVCPSDGIAGRYCNDTFPIRYPEKMVRTKLKWDDVLIYILVGPRSTFDVLNWWLQFVTDPIDMVFVADACSNNIGASAAGGSLEANKCTDSMTSMIDNIQKAYPLIRMHLVRALPSDSGYNVLSCKLRTGHKLIYSMFPSKYYYIKIDTDTVLLPSRLKHFLSTLDSVAEHGHRSPLYFGTMVESGIPQLLCKHHSHGTKWTFPEKNASLCYCQGGAGYGVSNTVMKHFANVSSCEKGAQSDLPEDLYAALEIYNTFNRTVGIHCGAFRSSELASDTWFKYSISFHYIDRNWIKTYGTKLKIQYLSHRHNVSSSN